MRKNKKVARIRPDSAVGQTIENIRAFYEVWSKAYSLEVVDEPETWGEAFSRIFHEVGDWIVTITQGIAYTLFYPFACVFCGLLWGIVSAFKQAWTDSHEKEV